MTHDELLDKLNLVWDRDPEETQWELIEKLRNALRAVVEYTKPNDWDFNDEKYSKLEIFKIIEKELK
jgi:hypothetical protein